MSEARTTVSEAPPRAMVAMRGRFGDAVRAAAAEATGAGWPGPLEARVAEGRGLLWMAPDEVLALARPDEREALVEALEAADAGLLVVDMSDARAVFEVTGRGAREVLARLTPADMAPGAMAPGAFRRTRLGQVAAGIWMEGEGTLSVMCFRSVAGYVGALLANAAASGSAGVFDRAGP